MDKISIRFFNDREVRAVWDEETSKWWFSVLDIVGVLNNQDDYTKNRNYRKYLKKEACQLFIATTQLKFAAAEFLPQTLESIEKMSEDTFDLITNKYVEMTQSVTDSSTINQLLQNALTDKINDREMFMKGIDYSYYYEEEN
ncbi:MAG: hypothetical protein GX677_02885 [Treponema sp.]|nr:hypothetical protein [Treponema sp.]